MALKNKSSNHFLKKKFILKNITQKWLVNGSNKAFDRVGEHAP